MNANAQNPIDEIPKLARQRDKTIARLAELDAQLGEVLLASKEFAENAGGRISDERLGSLAHVTRETANRWMRAARAARNAEKTGGEGK